MKLFKRKTPKERLIKKLSRNRIKPELSHRIEVTEQGLVYRLNNWTNTKINLYDYDNYWNIIYDTYIDDIVDQFNILFLKRLSQRQ